MARQTAPNGDPLCKDCGHWIKNTYRHPAKCELLRCRMPGYRCKCTNFVVKEDKNMIKYYELVKGSAVYDLAYKVFHCLDDWNKPEFEKEFTDIIGVSPKRNLICQTHFLQLMEIPNGKKDQFCKKKVQCKEGYAYRARVNSQLHKDFMDLVKKYKLTYYDTIDLTVGMGFGYWSYVHPFDNKTRFVMETKDLKDDQHERILKIPGVKVMTDEEFYTLKLAQAKSKAV